MWDSVLEADGPKGLAPRVLRDIGIYGGAQGVWVDKARTGSVDRTGTVGLLLGQFLLHSLTRLLTGRLKSVVKGRSGRMVQVDQKYEKPKDLQAIE